MEEWAQHFAEQFVLAAEIGVNVAYGDTRLSGYLTNGSAPYAVCNERFTCYGENALPYVVFECLHRDELRRKLRSEMKGVATVKKDPTYDKKLFSSRIIYRPNLGL